MRQVEPPARFRTARSPPQVLVVGGRRWVRLRREAARRQGAECLPGQRLHLLSERLRLDRCRCGDRIGEAAVVGVGEGERATADQAARHLHRIEGHGAERGTVGLHQLARIGIGIARALVGGHRQPPFLAAGIVGEPGGEDRVALMRDVESPSRFRSGRHPPQTLVIEGQPAGP